MSAAIACAAAKCSKFLVKSFVHDPIGTTVTALTIASYAAIPAAVAGAVYGICKLVKK